MSKSTCKVCKDKTEVHFNIDFKAVPICERCATSIFIQQASWYTSQYPVRIAEGKGTWKFKGRNEEGALVDVCISAPDRESAIVEYEANYPEHRWFSTEFVI